MTISKDKVKNLMETKALDIINGKGFWGIKSRYRELECEIRQLSNQYLKSEKLEDKIIGLGIDTWFYYSRAEDNGANKSYSFSVFAQNFFNSMKNILLEMDKNQKQAIDLIQGAYPPPTNPVIVREGHTFYY